MFFILDVILMQLTIDVLCCLFLKLFYFLYLLIKISMAHVLIQDLI